MATSGHKEGDTLQGSRLPVCGDPFFGPFCSLCCHPPCEKLLLRLWTRIVAPPPRDFPRSCGITRSHKNSPLAHNNGLRSEMEVSTG